MLTQAIRNLIPSPLKTKIKRALGMPLTRLHSDWEVLRLIGPKESHHVVLDVGAHHGWFFHCWQDWCPQAEVYAFEPTTESFERTNELYGADERVHLFRVGVGDRVGEVEFNILQGSQVSNSFLAPRQDVWKAIEYNTGEVVQRRVSMTTLNQFCAEQNIASAYLLKIDVQGFEMAVFKGATEILANIDYVFVEAGIQQLYEGAPSFAEICVFMAEQRFHLMHLRTWHRGNRVLVETDMIFRRNDLAPAIDCSRDRYYLELC